MKNQAHFLKREIAYATHYYRPKIVSLSQNTHDSIDADIIERQTITLDIPDMRPEDNESILFLKEMVRNRPGGEDRPQQQKAMLAIDHAIHANEHLLIQAGTGTGKSFAGLIPAFLSGKRIVYSTATKQLSEQLVDIDIPTLKKEAERQGARSFSYSLLKGRDNYLCLNKLAELSKGPGDDDLENQDGLFGEDLVEGVDTQDHTVPVEAVEEPLLLASRGPGFKPSAEQRKAEFDAMYKWVKKTRTGDRSEAPAVSDDTWAGFSVNNNDCLGRKICPFAQECFSERAREKAKSSQIVVTNHAVTALDLVALDPQGSMLGPREVYIFDEVHELDNYLSNAWGTVITTKMVNDALTKAKKFTAAPVMAEKWNKAIESAGLAVNDLTNAMSQHEDGLIWPKKLNAALEISLDAVASSLMQILLMVSEGTDEAQTESIRRTVGTVIDSIQMFQSNHSENVRWVKNEVMKEEDEFTKRFKKNQKKKSEPAPPSLHCAPIRIGPRLMEELHKREATMIGTSATITVGGKFDSPIHNFALNEPIHDESPRNFGALDAGTPFDYSKQAMLYLPNPDTFPSADYKTREEHSAAVEDTVSNLVQATGGRALILTTTTRRINEIAARLDSDLSGTDIQILRQGDMPAPQLIDKFVKDETSVLVATMGMWHGLNAEGPTCMLVVMDKIPFPTMDDPLATARKTHADNNKGNGFMDVYVASANVRLAQGFGRLIRTMTDRGIVAILDTRMTVKQYGRAMKKSFPAGVREFSDESVVIGAANRLREAREKQIAEQEE